MWLDNDMTHRLYKVLGTTDEGAGCEHCGRTNLKTYVVMEPVEGGQIVRFGTTCAAGAEKLTVKELKDEATAADKANREAAAAAKREAEAAERIVFLAWVETTYGVKADQSADLWNKVEGKTPFQLHLEWRAAA
jgi:microcystin-dependent protein